MREITSQTAAEYLQAAGRVAKAEPIEVRELTGGVSNVVLLVTLPARGERFVLKQARARLRVKDEWLCPVERIWREVEVLQICGELIQVRSAECGGRNEEQIEILVPQLLWEDHANYCYAMTAAPEEHRTWKEVLFVGEMELNRKLAAACGQLLGQLHSGSWANSEIAEQLDDRTYFEQLRLDRPSREPAQRPHIFDVFAQVFSFGRFQHFGNFVETSVAHNKAKRLQADLPFPDVLVTIDPRTTRGFGIVQVQRDEIL
jgi:hypothetical protein